jgi:chemotaxis protein CheX
MTSDKNGERGGRLQLKAVLDKRSADGLSADLMAMRGQDLYVDASSVNVLSGPCLQVLLAAVSDWAAEDRVLAFDDPSDAFIKALQQFGVAQSRSEP